MKFMKHVARHLLTLLAVIVAGALLDGLVGEFFMGGWGEGAIFGGIVAAFLGMLYDPRATTYTVPIRGGAEVPRQPGRPHTLVRCARATGAMFRHGPQTDST